MPVYCNLLLDTTCFFIYVSRASVNEEDDEHNELQESLLDYSDNH